MEVEAAFWAGVFAVAGAVVGATASFFGPYFLARHQASEARTRDRLAARSAALGQVLEALAALANADPPLRGEDRKIALAYNRGTTAFGLALLTEEEPASDYLSGVARQLSTISDHDVRMGTMNHAGQELLAWNRGTVNIDHMKPFDFIEYDDQGRTGVRFKDHW